MNIPLKIYYLWLVNTRDKKDLLSTPKINIRDHNCIITNPWSHITQDQETESMTSSQWIHIEIQ